MDTGQAGVGYGLGMVAQYSKGEILIVHESGAASVEVAETRTIQWALILAGECGWRRMIVENDDLSIMSMLKGKRVYAMRWRS